MSTCKWKPSAFFPDEYMVSSDGDVLSKRTKKILKPATDKDGYLYYVLCVAGNRKTVKAHRLVAMSYLPNPDHKPAIDHINGIRTDNRACNLRWVTNKENTNNPITKPNLISAAIKRIPVMYEASKSVNFGRKPVLITFQDGTEKVFRSLKEASEFSGKNYSKLSEVLNGRRNQDKRFTAVWFTKDHSPGGAVKHDHRRRQSPERGQARHEA